MTISASTKGLITKSLRDAKFCKAAFNAVRATFAQTMPAEQAKHATRNYLVSWHG